MKKIIIISEPNDLTTNKVMEWLDYYNSVYVRVNDDEFSVFNIIYNGEAFKTSLDGNIVWNRRGTLQLIPSSLKNTFFYNYLRSEQIPVVSSLEFLNKKNFFGSFINEYNNDKILTLKVAHDLGFEIPKTCITNNRTSLSCFIKKDKKYIAKSLRNPLAINVDGFFYSGKGTVEIDINLVPDFFSPSLVQEYVDKEFEVRVFFFGDFIFSMAIFSQNDDSTKLDYRNYNEEKPNRNVPFLLPDEIVKKIKKLRRKLNVFSGSIDLIYTIDKEYVFLEINHQGQFDWVSSNCNYYIEKHIARFLNKVSKYE